jgi:ADP-heptose:LPS heptosyltransferase
VDNHNLLDAVLDTGPQALPVKSLSGLLRFVGQLRSGHFDLALSLVRSPLMSLAVLLAGIPQRAGLDSKGRGFGYNVRAPIDPHDARPEAEIYLEVARALGIETANCYANVPVDESLWPDLSRKLSQMRGDPHNYLVINPAGGRNPGMTMDSKRWPPEHFAALADRLGATMQTAIVLIGGPGDGEIVKDVRARMLSRSALFVGELSFAEIALLAHKARLYVGNDTGLTHLAAAAGAKTAMILGPSDPQRYAPYVPDALALWKPTAVRQAGVSAGTPQDWDWARDGIGVEEVEQLILAYLDKR